MHFHKKCHYVSRNRIAWRFQKFWNFGHFVDAFASKCWITDFQIWKKIEKFFFLKIGLGIGNMGFHYFNSTKNVISCHNSILYMLHNYDPRMLENHIILKFSSIFKNSNKMLLWEKISKIRIFPKKPKGLYSNCITFIWHSELPTILNFEYGAILPLI